VLWIITDDATRRSLRTMPHTMQLLVRPGMNFVNGYVATPWCGPSRVSMLTGMYAHNHQVISNATLPRFVDRGLDQDTIATRMRNSGYTTGQFGKYLNGNQARPDYVGVGFDRWVDNIGTTHDDVPNFNIDGQMQRVEQSHEVADAFSAHHCRRFIRDHAHTPWFAMFAPTAPHDPYSPSLTHEHDFDHVAWDPPAMNEVDLSDKEVFVRSRRKRDREAMRSAWEGKLEELRDVDDQVRNIFRALSQTGQHDNTYIFMISDNGYLLGEHRLFRKEQPYEESAGVPFTVWGPGVRAGTNRELVTSVDLMPTTLSIAGLGPDAGRELDGRSMIRHLRSLDWQSWRTRLMCENPNLGWAMLREGNYAFIDYYSQSGTELYNLGSDPYQMRAIPLTESPGLHERFLGQVTELRASAGRALRQLEL